MAERAPGSWFEKGSGERAILALGAIALVGTVVASV